MMINQKNYSFKKSKLNIVPKKNILYLIRHMSFLVKDYVQSKKELLLKKALIEAKYKDTFGEPAFYFIIETKGISEETKTFWKKFVEELEDYKGLSVEASVGTKNSWDNGLNYGWVKIIQYIELHELKLFTKK